MKMLQRTLSPCKSVYCKSLSIGRMTSSQPKRKIDSLPPAVRTTPMKVLCLGHLRTGTISLDAALKILGYKSYHGKALMDQEQMKRDFPLWIEALKTGLAPPSSPFHVEGKRYGRQEFDILIGNYEALLEPSFLYKDLLEAYPDAKVVLTARSTKSWLGSLKSTIFPVVEWDWPSVVTADPAFAKPWWDYVRFVMWLMCGDAWEGGTVSAEAQRTAGERYEAHNVDVRRLVAKDKLLEWNPAEGWEPLCTFLGVATPNEMEFPRVNDKEEFVAFHQNWFEQLKTAKEQADNGAKSL